MILVDARAWQDRRFRDGSAAAWAASLLARPELPQWRAPLPSCDALVDPTMPALSNEVAALFDAQRLIGVFEQRSPTVLVRALPLAHSPFPLSRMPSIRDARTIALIDDNLMHDVQMQRLGATGCLENVTSLEVYDAFVTGSGDAARWLQQAIDINEDRVHVAGAQIRSTIIGNSDPGLSAGRYFLVVAAGCLDLELPLVAHALCDAAQCKQVRLIILGEHRDQDRIASIQLARDCGGSVALVEFRASPADPELAKLYSGAIATICPSRAAGFPMQAIEANANACPVLVADTPTYADLVPHMCFRFGRNGHRHLANIMEQLVNSPIVGRATALRNQGEVWRQFTPYAVSQRFWSCALQSEKSGAATPSPRGWFVHSRTKPRLAIFSPMPPDHSGIADFTAATIAALGKRAEIDVYSKTVAPTPLPFVRSIQPLSADPFLYQAHDARISVMGNSDRHVEILGMLLEHGGACIAHDARLVHLYASSLGRARTLEVARRELGREVSWAEIEVWMHDQWQMPVPFLSELAAAAEPLFVHSHVTKSIIADLYGQRALLLPFMIYRRLLDEFRGREGKTRARALLNIAADCTLVVTLGDVTEDKGLPQIIEAIEALASSGRPTHLALVGKPHVTLTPFLNATVHRLKLERLVSFSHAAVPEREYQAYLAAADAAIQLRTYGFGSLSGALLDCIAAGLPAVASRALADAMGVISYIRATSDNLSSISIAEDLRHVLEQVDRSRHDEERRAFVAAHDPEIYAERLLLGLNLA